MTKTSRSNHSHRHVGIVGAGVVGLGVGWRLAQAGAHVEIFDRGEAGGGATHAAAGMLAAGVETEPGEEALLALTLDSQARWPAFRDELEAVSGIDIGYRSEGTIVAALNRDDAERLRFNYDLHISLGLEMEWLSGAEARRREPFLRAGTAAAVFSPNDHQVKNRQLAAALKQAFLKAGGVLHENTAVESLQTGSGGVNGLVAGGEDLRFDTVLLAAGPWSREIGGLPEGVLPPVRPLKGQMLALLMDPENPLLRHVLWPPNCYMVPRTDGGLLIGATVEEKGFDDSLTAGGVYALLEAAWRAVPAIEELPIVETWVGFRPGSPDDAPILGPSELDGLVFATGHHRNGILLAPGTADMISAYILDRKLDPAMAPFTVDRFARTARKSA